MKIACFTVAAMDYFPQQEKSFAGGNALNQSIRFKQLGGDTAFVGAVGTDTAGKEIEALLLENGVNISHLHRIEGITACNRLVNDINGERFGVEGAWQDGVYGDFTLGESEWDFLSGFEIWTTHANGPNYEETLRHKGSLQLLAVDYLHFNSYELLEQGNGKVDIAYFGGTPAQKEELQGLSLKFQSLIVLTLGSGGSWAFERGIATYQEALPVETVVDTTGCGDAFQAGFTYEYAKSADVKRSLRAGAELGRIAAQSFGGIPWEGDTILGR